MRNIIPYKLAYSMKYPQNSRHMTERQVYEELFPHKPAYLIKNQIDYYAVALLIMAV